MEEASEITLELSPSNLPTTPSPPDPARSLPGGLPHPTSTLPLSSLAPSLPPIPPRSALHGKLLFDAEAADSPLLPRTFLARPDELPRDAAGMKEMPLFEYLALKILHHHTRGSGLKAEQDEELHAATGLHVHPHVSTVTYLTSHGGPTVVPDYRLPNVGGRTLPGDPAVAEAPERAVDVVYPEHLKHMSFDGRKLHGGDASLLPGAARFPPPAAEVSERYAGRAKDREGFKGWFAEEARVTFLVNVWCHHRPIGAGPVEGFYREAMVKAGEVLGEVDWDEEFWMWRGGEEKGGRGGGGEKEPEELVVGEGARTERMEWEISAEGVREVCVVDLPAEALRERRRDTRVLLGAKERFQIRRGPAGEAGEAGGEKDAKRQKYWWYEVWETYRRIALTGGLRLLDGGSGLQFAVGLLVCIFGLRTVAVKKPCLTHAANRLTEIVGWQLVLTFVGANVVSMSDGKRTDGAVDAFLIAVQEQLSQALAEAGAKAAEADSLKAALAKAEGELLRLKQE
ncbi:hypothetical protein TeGR_g12800 [Tetraparma gracilis]|uniref:Uncharacterized protein n=1 Tax=Tetraparma gracilis TaxID=2962635 RepID=A0ABQ6N1Y6_9STRA|nr:hypothetical protein TeGR_g12800 [Tetraparma gracilis]